MIYVTDSLNDNNLFLNLSEDIYRYNILYVFLRC